MSTSKEQIMSKLRAAKRPFIDAPPRPKQYVPVTSIDDISPEGMLERFTAEMVRLSGEVFVANGDEEATACVLDLLKSHDTKRIAAWHFKHIPVNKLYTAIQDAGYVVDYPHTRIDDLEARKAELDRLETCEVGLTGVDAVAASTATLIVSATEGKGRIATVLPPVHIAVVTLQQFVPRIENWIAKVRAEGGEIFYDRANICFITGPSRTGDIEKMLVLGVHGPKRVQVVVKK